MNLDNRIPIQYHYRLSTEGFRDMQMIADWKLEAMCKFLLQHRPF